MSHHAPAARRACLIRATRLTHLSAALVFAFSGLRAWAVPDNLGRKVEARLLAEAGGGRPCPCVVLLADQADLSAAYSIHDADARGWYVYRTLRAHARRTQTGLRTLLRRRGVKSQSLWAANAVVTTADMSLLTELAARADVRSIESNRSVHWITDPPLTQQLHTPGAAATIEWGVSNVNAPQVWALGFTGQGIVIGNQDTGMQWDHPAIQPHYRGWNGVSADHNFNWHDAIHSGGGVCGADSPLPCDDNGHGTFTTGIAIGDDGGTNQIGVAPGAQWIGCRNMDQGNGTPATYTECFQFFIAPTDVNGNNADPTRRPHIINNSWVCPPSEGCAPNTLQTVVENTRAAGIFVEVSAGNSGPDCSSVDTPASIYAASFTTGAYDISNTLAGFSSRGPVTVDGSNRLKPDIAAPGVNVRSSFPTNTYGGANGTSAAGPHVVGVVALLWSARPQLARDIDATETVLRTTANPALTVSPVQICGDISSNTVPNNAFGYGAVDALAAVNAVPILTHTPTGTPAPTMTPTASISATATATLTGTFTMSPTRTPTATISATPTAAATVSPLGTVTATATSTPGGPVCTCPGDADKNGFVNSSDFAAVQSNFGRPADPVTGLGDADCNGFVNSTDFAAVQANFGRPCSGT
jgi:serine protease AprX